MLLKVLNKERHGLVMRSMVIDAPLFHYCEMLLQQQDLQGFGGGVKGWMRVQ